MIEPIAIAYDWDGYGYKYIDSGSGSDWKERHEGIELFDHPQQETIVSAAIYHGATISLPPPSRHHTILQSMILTMGISEPDARPENQGFLTSNGRFVNRVEAFYIAQKSGQMIKNTSGTPELYSEDLW